MGWSFVSGLFTKGWLKIEEEEKMSYKMVAPWLVVHLHIYLKIYICIGMVSGGGNGLIGEVVHGSFAKGRLGGS